MRYETFIALRYLRARRKHALISVISLVSILGFTVGVAALIIALALMTGFREEVQQRILSTSAHILVQTWGSEGLENYADAVRKIEAVPGVAAASPAVYPKGLLVSAGNSEGAAVMFKAISPEKESLVTSLASRMESGSWEALSRPSPGGTPPVILGKDLASELGVKVGDRVRLILPQVTISPLGAMPRMRTFEVAGTFASGYYLSDGSWGIISLAEGQSLLGMKDAAQSIEVRVFDPDRVEEVSARLAGVLPPLCRVANWKEMNRPLFSAFKAEKLMMFLAIGLIVVVASFNIVTTLVLMVMEKNRDIGILKAMGARAQGVARVFVWQGFLVGAAGTALGAALGAGACWLFDTYRLLPLSEDVYYIPYVPFHLKALDVAAVVVAALAISLLATLYPSRQAAKLQVVDALKYE